MSIVLDSSVALAWIYAAEMTEAVQKVFEVGPRTGAWFRSSGVWKLAMFWKWGSDEAEPTPHFETPPSPTSVSFPSLRIRIPTAKPGALPLNLPSVIA